MRGETGTRGEARREQAMDFRVRGECMHGLREGERVRVRSRRIYAPGDVVVVRRADHFNVHRFLGYAWSLRGVRVLTQADGDTLPDPASLPRAIVGAVDTSISTRERVRSIVRYGRAVSRRVLRGGT